MPFRKLAERRQKALEEYRIWDAKEVSQFETLTTLASTVCETPIAIISLLDSHRQWFLSRYGLNGAGAPLETPLDISFCIHTISQAEEGVCIVHDAQKDERFAENPFVTGEPHVRFYAGVPLITLEGVPIGALSVIDRRARELSEAQIQTLKLLAQLTIQLLESRKNSQELFGIVEELKVFEGYWNLCVYCRRLKADDTWVQFEHFVRSHTNADFTHGVCKECMRSRPDEVPANEEKS